MLRTSLEESVCGRFSLAVERAVPTDNPESGQRRREESVCSASGAAHSLSCGPPGIFFPWEFEYSAKFQKFSFAAELFVFA